MKRLVLLVCLVAAPAFAQDQIDFSQAVIVNAPADVASWPITTTITELDMRNAPGDGLKFVFDAQSRWPDYTPPKWEGPIQYTVWACSPRPWTCSGFIQMWRDRAGTGAPILRYFRSDWAYDTRWGALAAYRPVVGDTMAFLVTAGNARDEHGVTSLRERSNVVLVNLPADDTAVFTFAASLPPPIVVAPPPQPVPPPVVLPDPAPPAPVDPPPAVPPPTPSAPVPPSPPRLKWWELLLAAVAAFIAGRQ